MAFLDSLFGIGAQIGQSFLAAELQRKQSRATARASVAFPFESMPAAGAITRRQTIPPMSRRSGGGTAVSTGEPIFNVGAWTDRRKWKAAVCRAVKRLELHPSQANAMLKMEGMKGCTRRMNPLNPRALTRAARRMEGFLRTVKRIEKAIPTKTRKSRSREHHHHSIGGPPVGS